MLQDLMEENVAAQYPIGMRIARGDWVLRYCKAGSTGITHPNRGAGNGRQQLEGNCLANAVQGAKTLDFPEAHVDNALITYTAEDVYKDGFVMVMGEGNDPTKHEMHRIRGNAQGNGSYVRVTLFEEIQHSQATPWITAYPGIYGDVQLDVANNIPTTKMAVVCVSLLVVQANYHFWGLTWGPMWTTAYSATPGAADNDRELYFRLPTGTITLNREFDLTGVCYQRAGFVLPNTAEGGDMCYMLQLAP